MFSDPNILARVTETKASLCICQYYVYFEASTDYSALSQRNSLQISQLSKEIEVLNKFMRLLDTNPDKAYYGYTHVQKANEELAIDSLLISDGLFRSSDVLTRKKYVSLVESVREKGGTVYVFSTMHVSGQVSAVDI
jgi:stalled ribosome rescue protein Dom34